MWTKTFKYTGIMRNDERWAERTGRREWHIQEPTTPQELDYLHWLNQKAIAESVVDSVSADEKQPLIDLLKLHAGRNSEYHYDSHGRRFDAENFDSIKQQMIKVGAPASLEFMGDMDAMARYTLFLNSRYPALDWSAVRFTYIENPDQPNHPDTLLPNEWLLDIVDTAKLGAVITHDAQAVLGQKFSPDMDYLFQRWFMVGSFKELNDAYQQALASPDNKPPANVSSSLEAIASRSEYYAGNIELLATHNKQFYPSQNPYEPLVSWNPYETQIMSLMVSLERHYDWLHDSLRSSPKPAGYQSRQNPLSRLKNSSQETRNRAESIAFEPSGEMGNLDPEKDTNSSTPEKKQEPQKAIDGDALWANGHQVFTTAEASAVLKISAKTLLRRIRTNEIRAVKMGNSYRIQRAELENALTQPYERRLDLGNDDYDPELGF